MVGSVAARSVRGRIKVLLRKDVSCQLKQYYVLASLRRMGTFRIKIICIISLLAFIFYLLLVIDSSSSPVLQHDPCSGNICNTSLWLPTSVASHTNGSQVAEENSAVDFQPVLAERLRRVNEVCEKVRGNPDWFYGSFSDVYLLKESQIKWCPVFKASTSSWLHFFLNTSTLISEARRNCHMSPRIS